MANDYKKDSLYVFGVVCANGVQDSWGDTLTKKDIKKLNSSYKNHEVDTNHNYLKNVGVSVVENYITTVPMIVRGKDVPVGSWVMGTLVWDEKLKAGIRSGELNGYSLCSRPATPELMAKFINRNDPPNYRDFEDKDDLNPLFVSIVDGAGNGFELDYTTYSAYIERGHKTEEKPMSENKFDEYLQFMEAVDKFYSTRINRSNPEPQTPQDDEKIQALEKELEETKKGYEEFVEKQTADKEELLKEIEELKEKIPQESQEGKGGEEGQEGQIEGDEGAGSEGNQGADVNRNNPNDFQTHGGTGKPQSQFVPADKFFDDGFKPRGRGYNGLPLN